MATLAEVAIGCAAIAIGAGNPMFLAESGRDVEKPVLAMREFAAALRQLALNSAVSQNMETVHGKKYIIDGTVDTPIGKSPVVRTVWIIDKGEDAPRLVTAYPHGG